MIDTIILFKCPVVIPGSGAEIVYICILTLKRYPPWENLKMGENEFFLFLGFSEGCEGPKNVSNFLL